MRYMGGKTKLYPHIKDIVSRNRRPYQWYIEPFVGGGNSIQYVDGHRWGCDIDRNVINALKTIRDTPESLPKNNTEFTEEMFREVVLKNRAGELLTGIEAWALYACSFGGAGSSWARGRCTDYVAEQYRTAQKQSIKLRGCGLYHQDYRSLVLQYPSIIYCDPPYNNTHRYKNKFDSDEFYQWCREQKRLGHDIYISEYSAPEDFILLYEKPVAVAWNGKDNKKESVKATEKLFTL